MADRNPPLHLSDAEWEIMDALWRLRSASARQVLEAGDPKRGWAYTTVKTMLDRLEKKGAVAERRVGRRDLYAPLLTRAAARRAALKALLERAFDGAWAPLLSFAAEDRDLSRKEREALRLLLEAEEPPCAPPPRAPKKGGRP